MVWFKRLKEDANIYSPRQCPNYKAIENFTIKLYHSGEMIENPKSYKGGSIDYFDYCSSDEISLIEIHSMLKEIGLVGGHAKLWYKFPNTTMNGGLFELESDDDVMLMCTLMPADRYIEVYFCKIPPLATSQPEMNDYYDFVEPSPPREPSHRHDEYDFAENTQFPFSTQCEEDIEQDLRDLEGLYKDFSDPEDSDFELRNEPWHIHISDYYKKDMYMKLYSRILEPIVGPEFWEETSEPLPLPPTIKVQTGRPKKKRNNTNDIPKDATKLPRVGTKVFCKYCKARSHNSRTCEAKKSDEIKKATEEGREPNIAKSKVTCKICKQMSHNSRTCALKKETTVSNTSDGNGGHNVGGEKEPQGTVGGESSGSKKAGKRVVEEDSVEHNTLTWKGKKVTTLRQLKAAKRARVEKME